LIAIFKLQYLTFINMSDSGRNTGQEMLV